MRFLPCALLSLLVGLVPSTRAVEAAAAAAASAGASAAAPAEASAGASGEVLFDWSPWRQHRAGVAHPSLTIKPADLARARENIGRYAWAKRYAERLTRSAEEYAETFTPARLKSLIEPTTPLSTIFTPCPACRDLGKSGHPHGQWAWNVKTPERVSCEICRTSFPNEKYPETITIETSWGTPQRFSFVGGEPFKIFSYATGRPSISGLIRARKVAYVGGALAQLGEAYLLSGEVRFARAARVALLRLAEVYPHWLVHSAYGEFADMDPRAAVVRMAKLPRPESVYPPNRPDGQIHTQFWSAGRATGSGQESHFLQNCLEAYDATCTARNRSGAAVYSTAERLMIEEKLLLEGTILLVADKPINNKSVGNRTAAAMVGTALGHPGLVRFGIDGFEKTVGEWFLPDGTTSESPSYALMTFSNTRDLPLALRGYSDPPGYRDPAGKRLDDVNLYRHPKYARAWGVFIDTLQGDGTTVPYADAYAGRKLDAQWAELLTAHYPDRPQYLALLKMLCGDDFGAPSPQTALYYRAPGLESKPAPPLMLPDLCPPELRIGHLRTGDDGRESLLVLSASHWGIHHHLDSLNLYYWKNGHELLSDLGYLWDNPKKSMTSRTLAHNTVLIDQAEQASRERGGKVHFFKTGDHVKVMHASSKAYPKAKTYQRTSAIIDHGAGRNYVVDCFDVEGGQVQDFIFHGPNRDYSAAGIDLAPEEAVYDLTNLRGGDASGTWTLNWKIGNADAFTTWSLGQAGERALIGDGWGQRESRNRDEGATIPYIVRRTTGAGRKRFVSVFEGHPAARPFVQRVTRTADGLQVETAAGRDIIVCSDEEFSVTSSQWTFHHER